MPLDLNSFHRHAAIRRHLQQEIAAIAPLLADVHGTTGLLLRAHACAPGELVTPKIGNRLDLALDETQTLRGSLTCVPDALPLVSESCKLVVVQHLFECIADEAGCAGEVARVLAPEGVLIVLGFNATSLWRPWLASKAAQSGLSLRFGSAQRCAQALGALGIDTIQTRYWGSLSPRWRNPVMPTRGATVDALARLRGGWMLLARKRRSALTPLRPRRDAREPATHNPRLAPGTQRECA
ncbi:MAG: methyltransferase domain-containing protein [Proteobacteria bacterium]|nr:methyltransferase domain-containing protein [Pseudomonadota bacterium]